MGKNYKANFNFFDEIDTPQKAYWLGFIWADGYIAKRERPRANGKTRLEYNLKLAIKDVYADHVKKFIDDIEGNYPVHIYETKGFDREISYEARAFITNVHMCSKLYEEYGVVPRRHDVANIISVIPKKLYRYFLLGVFDGDGAFTEYYNESYGHKMNVVFGGSAELLTFIEFTLTNEGVIDKPRQCESRKLYERHKGKDGTWRTLAFSGVPQCTKILNWLYDDSIIHLDRKYEKYRSLKFARTENRKYKKK